MPELALIWSYPAPGDADVPTNAELWVVLPYAWWNPVVRLDGRQITYDIPSGARGVVHVLPGVLEPNHDYVLQLDFTNVRPGADAGVLAVTELRFRTGSTTVGPPAAPTLGAYSASEPLLSPAVNGNCPEVIEAQACHDTPPNVLHSFGSSGDLPLAWVVGEHVAPAKCVAPQVLTPANGGSGRCFPVRAIGPGGRLSEATTACIPAEPSRDHDSAATSPDAAVDVLHSSDPGSATGDSGCSMAPTGGDFCALPLLLALFSRRRSRS